MLMKLYFLLRVIKLYSFSTLLISSNFSMMSIMFYLRISFAGVNDQLNIPEERNVNAEPSEDTSMV